MHASPHTLRFIPTVVKNVHIYNLVQDKLIISPEFDYISILCQSNKIKSICKQNSSTVLRLPEILPPPQRLA